MYVDGSYAGTIQERSKLSLRPGKHQIELRAPDGETFNQKIYVIKGQTLIIRPDFKGSQAAG